MSVPSNVGSESGRQTSSLTRSEAYLARLCERTFLRLWSFRNVYRDQGKRGEGVGKELCDLLVVLDHHVIIFSDKSCVFREGDDVPLSWKRWFKRAVWKSAEQIRGAERWLRSHPDRVFVDPKCDHPIPVPLPEPEAMQVHRVVVAVGAAGACQARLGGSGSLVIAPDIAGKAHFEGDIVEPFAVGVLEPARGYVHVLDEVALDVVLGEMDTVSDLVEYLTKKESFVQSGRLGRAAGEEDLLAYYMRDVGPDDRHDFLVPENADPIFLDEGFYEDMLGRPEYKARKEADRVSRLWDGLIEHVTTHVLGGTLASASHGTEGVERQLRIMAREPRVSRRLLSRQIKLKIERTPPGEFGVLAIFAPDAAEDAYVFMLFPVFVDDYVVYRAARVEMLKRYCMLLCLEKPTLKRVVGIATDSPPDRGASEDLILYEHEGLSPEVVAELRRMQKETGLLERSLEQVSYFNEKEYPDVDVPSQVDPDRNIGKRPKRAAAAQERSKRKRPRLKNARKRRRKTKK